MPNYDTSVIMGYKPIDIPDPQNQLLKALQAQSLMGQNRLQDLKVQDAQTDATQKNALMSLIGGSDFAGLDPAAKQSRVLQAAPTVGQAYAKNLLDMQRSQGDVQKIDLENHSTQIKIAGQVLGAAADHSPQAALEAFNRLPATIMPPEAKQAMRAEFEADPIAAARKLQTQALTPEQQVSRNDSTFMQTDQGIAALNKRDGSGRLVMAGTGGQSPATLNQPFVGQQPAGNFQGDPAAVYAGLQRISNPVDRAAALRAFQNQLAGANPVAGTDGVFQGQGATGPVAIGGSQAGSPVPGQPLGVKREEIDYRTNPLNGDTMQFPKYAAPGQVIRPGVVASGGSGGATSGLSEAALNDAATRLAHGDSSVLQNYGRGIQGGAQLIAIRNRAAEIAATEGRSADDQTASGVALFGEKAGARTLGTRSANLGVAANELNKFSDIALNASKNVPRTQFVPLNKAVIAVQGGTGSPEVAAFVAANESVINAFAQVAGRGTVTVAGQEHARQMLNTAQTPEQYDAVVRQLKIEAKAALESAGEVQGQQRARMTGQGSGSSGLSQARLDELAAKYGRGAN